MKRESAIAIGKFLRKCFRGFDPHDHPDFTVVLRAGGRPTCMRSFTMKNGMAIPFLGNRFLRAFK
jgi:hypothetical protein